MAMLSIRRKLLSVFHPIPAMLLLALASVTLACDTDSNPDIGDDFRGGSPITATGQEFGPCHHDDNYTYHWCDPTNDPERISVCAIPQMPDMPHATVCLIRQAECPIAVAVNGVGGYLVEQDYAKACSLVCEVDEDCPTNMSCLNNMCAWETF